MLLKMKSQVSSDNKDPGFVWTIEGTSTINISFSRGYTNPVFGNLDETRRNNRSGMGQ